MILGARSADPAGMSERGAAWVFRREGRAWVQEAMLVASDGLVEDCFGVSVSISADGSTALVGAQLDDTAGGANAGSARVFTRAGTVWTQDATLLAPDGETDDRFGTSVALSQDGTVALIGADIDDTTGAADSGSARVYRRSGSSWAFETTILPPGLASSDGYGAAVALSGDGERAFVGAYGDDASMGTDSGTVHVFVHGTGTTWTREASLSPAVMGASLGCAVAANGDGSRAVAGAYARSGTGSVFLFSRVASSWTVDREILLDGAATDDQFGLSVGISGAGTTAGVGAPGATVGRAERRRRVRGGHVHRCLADRRGPRRFALVVGGRRRHGVLRGDLG